MFLTLLQSQVAPVIIRDRGDSDNGRRKRRYAQEVEQRERKRRQLIEAYEQLVEAKPAVAEAIVQEFRSEARGETLEARVDWDRLLDSLDAAQRLYDAWIDMDDDDVMMLL